MRRRPKTQEEIAAEDARQLAQDIAVVERAMREHAKGRGPGIGCGQVMVAAFVAMAALTLFGDAKFRGDWTSAFATLEITLCIAGALCALNRRLRVVGILLFLVAFGLLNLGLKPLECSWKDWSCFYG